MSPSSSLLKPPRPHPYSSPRTNSTGWSSTRKQAGAVETSDSGGGGPTSFPLPSRGLQPLSTRSPLPGLGSLPVRTGKKKAEGKVEDDREEEEGDIDESDGWSRERVVEQVMFERGEILSGSVGGMLTGVQQEEGRKEEEGGGGGTVELDTYPLPLGLQQRLPLAVGPLVPQSSAAVPQGSPTAIIKPESNQVAPHPPRPTTVASPASSTCPSLPPPVANAAVAAIARSLGPQQAPESFPPAPEAGPSSSNNSPPPAYTQTAPLFPWQDPAAVWDNTLATAPAEGAPVEPVEVEEVVMLSEEQQNVLDMVLSGQSLFFTGSAGTGKSFLLGHLIKKLKKSKKADGTARTVAVTASTGIAGLNINGQTLHSWSGVGLGIEDAETLAKKVMGSYDPLNPAQQTRAGHRPALERWLSTDVLIIDEISMIDGRFYDKLEYVGRCARGNNLPFGGIQLVLVGDFFQLPPVPNKGAMNFAFEAVSWKACVPKMVHLSKVFRQKDDSFVRILNQMRLGCLDKTSNRILSGLKREIKYPDDVYSELYPVKAQVDSANFSRLKALPTQPYCYRAEDIPGRDENDRVTSPERTSQLLNGGRAPAEITLKVGAVVMLIVNLQNGSLCNGSLGKVVAFETRYQASRDDVEVAQVRAAGDVSDSETDSDADVVATDASGKPITKIKRNKKPRVAPPPPPPSFASSSSTYQSSMARPSPWDRRFEPPRDDGTPWPVVEFVNGTRLLMTPHDFEEQKFARGKIVVEATRHQVPLILAWAISIHKSQGQTLSRVKIDLGRTFEKGQAYVAVSRCTSLDTLQIINYLPSKVTAHPSVLAWARREGLLQLDPDLTDESKWSEREVDLGGGMGMGKVIRIGRR